MTEKELKENLRRLREHYDKEENNKTALITYYDLYSIAELLDIIWEVAVNNGEAESSSY